MPRLSKPQIKAHQNALKLLNETKNLSHWTNFHIRDKIYQDYREDMETLNAHFGAFFTPLDLAEQLAFYTDQSDTIIDLCAGIGILSYASIKRNINGSGIQNKRYVCIESNPVYYNIGKILLPEAEWYLGDVTDFDLIKSLGRFDCVISNPPFGNIPCGKSTFPFRYTKSDFEYKVIEIGSYLSDYANYIIPQSSCPFILSNSSFRKEVDCSKYNLFNKSTGIVIKENWGSVDTNIARGQWKGTNPIVEIAEVSFDFDNPIKSYYDLINNKINKPQIQLSLNFTR